MFTYIHPTLCCVNINILDKDNYFHVLIEQAYALWSWFLLEQWHSFYINLIKIGGDSNAATKKRESKWDLILIRLIRLNPKQKNVVPSKIHNLSCHTLLTFLVKNYGLPNWTVIFMIYNHVDRFVLNLCRDFYASG